MPDFESQKPTKLLLAAIFVASLTACGGEDTSSTAEEAAPTPTPAAAAPAPEPEPAPAEEPEEETGGVIIDGRDASPATFLDNYPSRPISAAVGDQVVVGAPDGTSIWTYIGEVTAIEDELAAIQVNEYVDVQNVPGELIGPSPELITPAVGDTVVGLEGSNIMEGRVVSIEDNGKIMIEVASGLDRDLQQKRLDLAYAPPTELAPLALITYEKNGKRHLGQLIAISGDQALYKDAGARGGIVGPLDSLELRPPRKDWKVGDEVRVSNFGIGLTDGKIVSADDNGFYTVEVKIFSEPEEKPYWYTQILPR